MGRLKRSKSNIGWLGKSELWLTVDNEDHGDHYMTIRWLPKWNKRVYIEIEWSQGENSGSAWITVEKDLFIEMMEGFLKEIRQKSGHKEDDTKS